MNQGVVHCQDGQVRHGEHCYEEEEKVEIIDRIREEDEDIIERVSNFEVQFKDALTELNAIREIIFLMGYGFFDNGKSFEKGLKMIDEQYGLLQWLSP